MAFCPQFNDFGYFNTRIVADCELLTLSILRVSACTRRPACVCTSGNFVVAKHGSAAIAIVPLKPGFGSSGSPPSNFPLASNPCDFRASTNAVLILLLHHDLTVLLSLRVFELTFHHSVSLLRLSHRFLVGRYSTCVRSLRMASARGRGCCEGVYLTLHTFNPATLSAVASGPRNGIR